MREIRANPTNLKTLSRKAKPGDVFLLEDGEYDLAGEGAFMPPAQPAGTSFEEPLTVCPAKDFTDVTFTGKAPNAAGFNLSSYKRNILLKKLHFKAVQGHAIFLRGCDGVQILCCRIEDSLIYPGAGGNGIHCLSSKNVAINRCSLTGFGVTTGGGAGEAIYVKDSDHIFVSASRIGDAGHYGITFENSSLCSVVDTSFSNTQGGGLSILLSSAEINVTRCLFESGTGTAYPTYPKAAIQCCGELCEITDNTINGTAFANPGIVLYAYTFGGKKQHCKSNTVEYNLIRNCGGPAVVFNRKDTCINEYNKFQFNVLYQNNQQEHPYYHRSAVVFDDYHAPENRWSQDLDGNLVIGNVLEPDATRLVQVKKGFPGNQEICSLMDAGASESIEHYQNAAKLYKMVAQL